MLPPELTKLLAEHAWTLALAGGALLLILLMLAWSTGRNVRRIARRQDEQDKKMTEDAERIGHAVAEKVSAAIPGEEGIRGVAKDEIARGFVELQERLSASEKNAEHAARARAEEIKRLLTEHAVYLHDRFADIAAREEERLRATRESAAEDAARRAAEDRAEARDALNAALERFSQTMSAASTANAESLSTALKSVADSMNRLAGEVDAKLSRMLERVENRLTENIGDARKSFDALRAQMDKLAEERSGIEEVGRDVAAMSRVMLARTTHGAEGAVQLSAILENALSPENFALNAAMPSGVRADALLKLPPPNGDIAVDAGFSLANFARLTDDGLTREQRESARRDFAADVRARIDYVANNLIPEGAGGALLFVPAEAAFAELHAKCRPEVEHAARRRVWLTSPATMLAVINTARAALRDHRARMEVERLRDGLREVAELFSALESQMAEIGGHVDSAWRGMKSAEDRGTKLMGRVRTLTESAEQNAALDNRDPSPPSHPTPPTQPSPSSPPSHSSPSSLADADSSANSSGERE